MNEVYKPNITVFYCINAFEEVDLLNLCGNDFDVKVVSMACSSMVKDVYLLRAFEAGADGVIILLCPEGQCRYVSGNLRAKKRVEWTKKLLDEIGINGKRLFICNVSKKNESAVTDLLQTIGKDMADLGPNPASLIKIR